MRTASGLWLALACIAVGMLGAAQQPFTVSRIEILGNQNVPTREILAAVGFQVGDTVDAARVREAAQAIEDLGYFAKVTPELAVEDGEVVVKFTVVEFPKIRRITLLGVPELHVEGGTLWAALRQLFSTPQVSKTRIRSILKEHGVHPGAVLNKVKLQEALEAVLKEYEDKDLATVQIGQVIPGEELIIEIQELPVLGHRFSGLSTVPEQVPQEMITVPTGQVGRYSQIQASFRWLSSSIYFTAVNVVPELDAGGVWLHWELEERVLLPSPQELRGIELVGEEAVPVGRLTPLLGPLPSGPATNYDVLRALEEVNRYLRREGYFMVDFRPAGVEAGILKVEVREGKIARIVIQGTPTTQARVIRRVMDLREGEFLTEARFSAARQALMTLGYFSDVTLTPAWEEEGLVLSVEVHELKKLGRIGGSMAFSPQEGLVGNLEYSQKNLFGTGQDVSLTLSKGVSETGSTTWTLGYKGHAFPVYDLVALDLYRKTAPLEDGSKVTLGGSFTLAYPLDLYLDLKLRLTSEQSFYLPTGGPSEPRTALTVGVSYDSRDNPFFTRTGYAGFLSLEKAGTFAPGVEYFSVEAQLIRFWPIDLYTPWGNWRAAFAQRTMLKLGWDLPAEYQYELGGLYSVRGADASLTDRLGLLNTELRFELADGLSLALFGDLGVDLSQAVVKGSVGLEIAVHLGGMFFRIDIAWPSDRPWTWVPAFEFDMAPMF